MMNGVAFQLGANQIFHPFHYFVTRLADAYRAIKDPTWAKEQKIDPTNVVVASDEYNDRAKKNDPNALLYPLDATKLSEDILKMAYDLDVAIHGDRKNGTTKRQYQGKAQLAFDKIAASNLTITTNGKLRILRDVRSVPTRGADGKVAWVNTVAAACLIGPLTFEHKGGNSTNRLLHPKLVKQLEKAVVSLRTRGKEDTLKYRELEKIVSQYAANPNALHMFPLTYEDLHDIFINGQNESGTYENISEGFGLRTPLHLEGFSEALKGWPDLTGRVTTSFLMAQPSVVGISFGEVGDVSGEEVPTTQREQSTSNKVITRVRELFESGVTDVREIEANLVNEFPEEIVASINLPGIVSNMKSSTVLRMAKERIRNLITRVDFGKSTKEVIEKALTDSSDAIFRQKYAARDFIKLVTLLQLWPGAKTEGVKQLEYFAFAGLNAEDKLVYGRALMDVLTGGAELGAQEILVRVQEITDAWNELAEEYGLSTRIENNVQETGDGFLGWVDSIAKAMSSEWRKKIVRREETPVVQTINDLAPLAAALEEDDTMKARRIWANLPQELKDKVNKLAPEANGDPTSESFKSAVYELIDDTRDMLLLDEELDDIGELITDEEAETMYKKLITQSLMDRIRRIFARKSGEAFEIVDLNHMFYRLGKRNWGLYKNGIISVARHRSGKVGSKVVRHEVFHKIFHEYLSSAEQTAAYKIATDAFGALPHRALEESLANAFMDFVAKKVTFTGWLADIFKRILRFIGFTYANMDTMESFFQSIEEGAFSNRIGNGLGVERDLAIQGNWETLEHYRFAKQVALETFNTLYNTSRIDPNSSLLSFDEAVGKTFDLIREALSKPESGFSSSEITEEFVRSALAPLISLKVQKQFKDYFFGDVRGTEASITQEERLKAERAELAEQIREVSDELLNTEDLEEERVDFLEKELERLQSDLGEKLGPTEADLVDPKSKLTGRVKQRLIAVKYGLGTEKYADFNKVFGTLLDLLPQADTGSLTGFISSVKHRIQGLVSGTSEVGPHRTVRLATAAFLANQLNTLQARLQPTGRLAAPKNLAFFRDVNAEHEYIVYHPTEDVTGLTRSEVTDKEGYVVMNIQRNGDYPETLDAFAERVSAATGMDKPSIHNAYMLFEDLTFVRSLIAAVASLRKNNPYVGVQMWKNFRFRTFYYETKSAGDKAVIESNIISGFVDWANSAETANPFKKADGKNTTFVDKALAAHSTKDSAEQYRLVKLFLERLGITGVPSIKEVSPVVVASAFNKLKLFIDNYDKAIKEAEAQDELSEYIVSPYEIITDEGSFVDALMEMVSPASDLVKVTSYTRGDGKRAYKFVDASFQSSLLTALTNAAKTYVGQAFNHLRTSDSAILSEPYSNNIFVGKSPLSRIHGYANHDSIKTKGQAQFATYLFGESRIDYLRRTFVFGFLSKVSTGTYFQYLPIPPSNRRSIDAVQVNVLKSADIDKALLQIIKGERSRVSPEEMHKRTGTWDKTYAKRWNKFTFPGLVDKAGNPIPIDTKLSDSQLVSMIKEHFKNEAAALNKEWNNLQRNGKPVILKNTIDYSTLEKAAITFGVHDAKSMISHKEYGDKRKELYQNTQISLEERNAKVKELDDRRDATLVKMLEAVLPMFYANSAVNQYSLSQLIYGDEAFYKSKEDQTKRIGIATATGDQLLVDAKYGLRPTARVGVIRDITPYVSDSMNSYRPEAFREEFNLGDGQGFMLPEAYERFARAYGFEASADVTIKPVYFALDKNGKPFSLKYSVIVLTDELLADQRFAHLRALRDNMRAYNEANPGNPMEQAVFESAVKMGIPVGKDGIVSTHVQPDGGVGFESDGKIVSGFSSDSVVDIDHRFLRVQLNPAKDVDTTVANPSQLTAMMNTNGLNQAEISMLHRLNAMIIELGDRKIARNLLLNSKGGLSGASFKKIRQMIGALKDVPGAEDVARWAMHQTNKRFDVSLNIPVIANKAIATIASSISKDTVSYRFKGSKLVLQSEFGTYTAAENKLKYKDADGFTEVLMPREYQKFFSTGDVVSDSMLGFRIPSTNYHSGLALKIVGFYDVPANSKGNVIIAPAEIVYYHGSDYDIDTLFIIGKRTFGKEKGSPYDETLTGRINLNDYLSVGATETDDLTYKEGEIVGFRDGKIQMIKGKTVAEYLYEGARILSEQIQRDIDKIGGKKGKERDTLNKAVQKAADKLEVLLHYAQDAAKNTAVHLFSSNLRDSKNRRDLLTPITFARVALLRSEVKKTFEKEILDETFIDSLVKAGLLTRC